MRKTNHLLFVGLSAGLIALFSAALLPWIRLALDNERYSHLVLIPFVSAILIYQQRREIFADTQPNRRLLGLSAAGAFFYLLSLWHPLGSAAPDRLTLPLIAFVAAVIGAFGSSYGLPAMRAAGFPLGFLVFMVPLPVAAVDRVVGWLQAGSATVVDILFSLSQVPFFRTGARFDLPGLAIEIAQECSGIRSSIALLLITLILGHMALRSKPRKLLLALSVIPLVLFKNGVRIVTLSLLAIYVDPRFLTGAPHQQGGFFFFGLVLMVVFLLCQLLRRGEQPKGASATASQ